MVLSAVYVPGACIEKAIVFDQKPPEKCNVVANSGTNKKESCSSLKCTKKIREINRQRLLAEQLQCHTAKFTGHHGVFTGFPCCWETLWYLQIAGKSYNHHGVSPQSINITGFIHNIYKVSLWLLQTFSIDNTGFTCRYSVIPSPCSFHGVKICSVDYFQNT